MFVELDLLLENSPCFPEIIIETTNEIFVLVLDHLKRIKVKGMLCSLQFSKGSMKQVLSLVPQNSFVGA